MNWLAVALGGAMGASGRYAFARFLPAFQYPLATQCINVLGSFLIGVLFVQISGRLGADHPAWALLGIGLLGGFTTFSTFSLDAVRLIEQDRIGLALVYVGSSVALCLVAAALGLMLGRRLL